MEFEYIVRGIDCANCAREIEEKINKLDQVDDAVLNFITQKLSLELVDDCDSEEVIEKVMKIIRDSEDDILIEEV